jgi:predicted RNA-binding Zn-ribbon protein involved in translation (DUF1610 family)
MFSDTHFHFQKMAQQCKNGVEVLSLMAQNNCFFGLDIGTNSDDLLERQSFCEQTIAQITNHSLAEKAREFLYFSAGIWPDVDSIHDRINKMNELKNQINIANQNEDDTLHRKIIAVVPCRNQCSKWAKQQQEKYKQMLENCDKVIVLNEKYTPTCPKCGELMVKRVAKKGEHAGEEFYGCSNYPNCKGFIYADIQKDSAPKK